MIELQSNYSGFIGFRYQPIPKWKQLSGKKAKPLFQLHLFLITVNIDMPFNHLAKKQFGSKSEAYAVVVNKSGYRSSEWGSL